MMMMLMMMMTKMIIIMSCLAVLTAQSSEEPPVSLGVAERRGGIAIISLVESTFLKMRLIF